MPLSATATPRNAFTTPSGWHERLGLKEEAEALSARLAHIKAVFQKPVHDKTAILEGEAGEGARPEGERAASPPLR